MDDQAISIKLRPQEALFKGFRSIIASLYKELAAASGRARQATFELISDITGLIDIGIPSNPRMNQLYVERISFTDYKISVYYPVQFQALRLLQGVNHADFIRSLSCSNTWSDNTGGKSNASFIRSYDNLYVFKAMKKFEFNMLASMIFNYFEYMWKVFQPNRENSTALTKIFGMYEVTLKESNTKYYYIAMENVFFGFEPTRIYDLKGSDISRYIPNPKQGEVLLDTNFKLDQNGEPIGIETKRLQELMRSLTKDAQFLAGLNRVDYSLLLVINDDKMLCKVGIIDYLREYTLDKQLEHFGKKVMRGSTPTIVNPHDYMVRFLESMEKYFMEIFVEDDHKHEPNKIPSSRSASSKFDINLV